MNSLKPIQRMKTSHYIILSVAILGGLALHGLFVGRSL